jgi:uncharacterized damage-inducible protein DinB
MPGQVAPLTDERALLLAYVAQQRYVLELTAFGLTDEQARATPTAGPLSVGGLIKHVAAMERSWMDTVRQVPVDVEAGAAAYGEDFVMQPGDTLAELVADLRRAGAETEALIASIDDLGQAVPVPKDVPWYPQDVAAWSVRWVLLHLVEELARHAGHADMVREAVDGATAFPLLAAAEGWPSTPWLQPWTPEAS